MHLIFISLISVVLVIYITNLLVVQKKRSDYIKAGKKWDGIVKELRKRK